MTPHPTRSARLAAGSLVLAAVAMLLAGCKSSTTPTGTTTQGTMSTSPTAMMSETPGAMTSTSPDAMTTTAPDAMMSGTPDAMATGH